MFPRVSISERPQAVANRERFGDWKGDTLEGAKGGGAPSLPTWSA